MKSILLSESVERYKYVIMSNHLFEGIDNNHLLDFFEYLKSYSRHYDKGETINHLGDEIKYAGLILDGKVKAVFYDETLNTVTLKHFYPGEMFCISVALLHNYKSNLEVISENNTNIIFVNLSTLLRTHEKVFKNNEYHLLLSSNLIRLMSKHAEFLQMKVRILGQRKTKDKLRHYLLHVSIDYGMEFELPISITDLATFLNTNRSQLYKALNELKEERFLDYEGGSIKLLKTTS